MKKLHVLLAAFLMTTILGPACTPAAIDCASEEVFCVGLAQESKIVGMIACLKQQKDPCNFVRACAMVQQHDLDSHFVLVGDGELQPEVSAEIQKLPRPENFHFLGWRPKV